MSLSIVTTYTVIDCYSCGALFAVPDQVNDELRRTGKDFYCPNGHAQHYMESTVKQLQREREKAARLTAQLDQTRADRDAAERSRRALKGQVTKVRNRVGKGVCPCCNRTFADLARHMETKHPEYAGDPTPEPASA